MATSKSWLMPIESSRGARRWTPPSRAVAAMAADFGTTAARLWVVVEWRQHHQPYDRFRTAGRTVERIPSVGPTRPVPRGLAARDRPASAPRPAPRPPRRPASSSAAERRCRRNGSSGRSPAAFRALFDCRWPMRCHRIRRRSAAIFCRASCTLFSPKSSCPAAAAARTSIGKVFDTATRRTAWGLRPDAGGGAIRDAIATRLRKPGAKRPARRLLQLRDASSWPGGERTLGRELQVCLEVGHGLGHLAFVHERHARAGSGRRRDWVGRDGVRELTLASAILPAFHRMMPWL